MATLFHVLPTERPGEGRLYEVIAGPTDGPGVLVAAHPLANVADDLALLLNRLAERYGADGTDRTSRELTWDLLYRLDALAPRR